MGSIGDSFDNALAESTIGQLKAELIERRGPGRTNEQLEFAVFEYLDWWNHRRLHGEMGVIPPVRQETHYYARSSRYQRPVPNNPSPLPKPGCFTSLHIRDLGTEETWDACPQRAGMPASSPLQGLARVTSLPLASRYRSSRRTVGGSAAAG